MGALIQILRLDLACSYKNTMDTRFIACLCLLGAAATAGAATGGADQAPFAIARNRLLLPGHVNETGPYLFILDLAAPQSVLDTAVAKYLQLQPSPTGTVLVKSFQAGDLAPHSVEMAVTDLSPCLATLGTPVAGILRARDLGNTLELDFSGNSVAVSAEPLDGAPPAVAAERGEDGELLVNALVNESHMCKCVLDLAFGGTVGVPERRLREWDLLQDSTPCLVIDKPPLASQQPDGDTQLRIKRLKLANREVLDPVCDVLPAGAQPKIGLGFLQHFLVRLDLDNGVVRLERHPAKGESALREGPVVGFGVALAEMRGKQWTLWVARNSPASAAGLLSGALLLSINGKDTAGVTTGMAYSELAGLLQAKPGGAITLAVQQGDDVRTVTLVAEKLL